MKSGALLWLLSAAAVHAELPAVAAPSRDDVIFYTDGSRRAAKILGLDAKSLRIRVPEQTANQPEILVSEPRCRVSRIEFAPDEVLDDLLKRAAPERMAAIEAAWRRAEAFLPIPRSTAAAIGNIYAGLLLRSGDNAKQLQALALFSRIEREAWDAGQKARAASGRLRAMVATGRAAEAAEEARALAAAGNREAVADARLILADAAAMELRRLVEDNPRWAEDPRVRPDRQRLHDAAIDNYLHPFLFCGSDSEAASRGLEGLMDLYRTSGESVKAREVAEDIAEIYPAAFCAARARAFLAAQSTSETQPASQ